MGILDILRRSKKNNEMSGGEKGLSLDMLRRLEGASNESESGVAVTVDSSMRVSAVYAAVRVLSESIAALPCIIYKRVEMGKNRDKLHPNYRLLHDKPNSFQTAFEFWEMVVAHICLRGNMYLFKSKNNQGLVRELLPLDQDAVTVQRNSDWSVDYFVSGERFTPKDITHIRGLSFNGYSGVSPIAYHKNTIGLAMEADNYGSRYFKNNAKPAGVIEHPSRLGDEAYQRLKNEWHASYGGKNTGKTAILEENMKFNPVSMSNEDGQYIETRKFQIEEIARIFRVPAVLLQHSDKTATYASSEQFFLAFVKYSLLPWIRRIESRINLELFSPASKHFSEFLVDGLERADAKTRMQFYASALQNKWMTRNEVRERENLNRVEGGDEFENPAITPGKGENDDGEEPESEPEEEGENDKP